MPAMPGMDRAGRSILHSLRTQARGQHSPMWEMRRLPGLLGSVLYFLRTRTFSACECGRDPRWITEAGVADAWRNPHYVVCPHCDHGRRRGLCRAVHGVLHGRLGVSRDFPVCEAVEFRAAGDACMSARDLPGGESAAGAV